MMINQLDTNFNGINGFLNDYAYINTEWMLRDIIIVI